MSPTSHPCDMKCQKSGTTAPPWTQVRKSTASEFYFKNTFLLCVVFLEENGRGSVVTALHRGGTLHQRLTLLCTPSATCAEEERPFPEACREAGSSDIPDGSWDAHIQACWASWGLASEEEEPEWPAPKRGEPERPAPKRGEPEHPRDRASSANGRSPYVFSATVATAKILCTPANYTAGEPLGSLPPPSRDLELVPCLQGVWALPSQPPPARNGR
ncbi:UNVERIFIED_CONTAM: hypothetical protein FKN15_052054 [Acipenser sinensis]